MFIYHLFKNILFVVFFISCVPSSVFAQDTSIVQERPFDEAEWRKRTEHLDYTEVPHPDKKEHTSWTPSFAFDLPPVVGMLIKMLLILVLVALLVFLLLRIVGAEGFVHLGNRKIRPQGNRDITLENIDENVLDATFEPFIRAALAEKNYGLAIRLYYLWLIKDLSLAEQIVWKKDKTNAEYIRDIKNNDLIRPFRNLTNIYERVWYGECSMEEAEFRNIEPQFKAFLSRIAT